MPWLTKEQVWSKFQNFRGDHQKNYFGFYSSRLGGFSREMSAMLIPLDDHMVHRGDGIFEVFRVMDGTLIDVKAHLARLHDSARAVGVELRWSDQQIIDLCLELVRLCHDRDSQGKAGTSNSGEGLIRLFVSRGEGGFTTNPKECLQSELYLVMTKFKAPPVEWYETGVSVVSSKWTWKESPFAQIKSCNYLLNVFLKQEANEAGVQFSVGFDVDGFMTESSTENVMLIDHVEFESGGSSSEIKNARIIIPEWTQILRGTTLLWVIELAKANGFSVEQKKISRDMIRSCREAAIVGTTWGVLPIGKWDGSRVGDSTVTTSSAAALNSSTSLNKFPASTRLRDLLNAAMLTDSSRRID